MKVEIHKSDEKGNIITLLEGHVDEFNGMKFTVPAGFRSDGVSTPEFLWATVSPAVDPRTLRGGVCHDYIYRTQVPGWTRTMADEMFYQYIRADGLGWYKAQKAYWCLRLFGGNAWRNNAK